MSFSGIKYVDEPKKEKKEATTETASNKVAELSTSNKDAK
jgi:hypothetical protein